MHPLDPITVSPEMTSGLPLIGAMMSAMRTKQPDDDDDAEIIALRKQVYGGGDGGDGYGKTIGQMLKQWGHLSVTVSIIIFVWGLYEGTQAWRRDAERTMAINTERILELRELNKTQDAANASIVSEQTRRIDIQREDIRELQRQLNTHFSHDDQRFGRVGISEPDGAQRYRNSGKVR